MDPRYNLEFKDTETSYHFSDRLDQCSFVRNMNQLQILQIFLAMAEAISRMHAKGLIHGDLNGGNYIIDFDDKTKPPVVNIMDGERSYTITDEYATSTPQTLLSWSDCYFPPERTGNKKTKPDVSQDVYTFAQANETNDEARRKIVEDARIAEEQRKKVEQARVASEQAKIKTDKQNFYIHITNLFKCSDNKTKFLSLLKNNLPLLSRHQILDLFADLRLKEGEYKFIHSQQNPKWDRLRLFFKSRANSEKNFWHTDTYQKAVKMLKDEYLNKGMSDPVDRSRYGGLHMQLLSYVCGNGMFHKSETGTFKQFTQRLRILDESRNQLKF